MEESQNITIMRAGLRLITGVMFFMLVWIMLPAAHVLAATLYLSPSTATVGVNGTVSVGVYVATNGETMNAASAKLSFPPSALSVSGISKSGSIINLWASEPSYSNSTGTISLEGVVLNPGYNGNSGKIATITFTAHAEGTPNVQFTSGSVLKNDGMGTEMLSGKSGSTITVDGVAAPAPSTSSSSSSSAGSAAATKPTVASLQTPSITEFPTSVTEGETISIRGTSASGATVEVNYQAENGDSRTDIVVADAEGIFLSSLINASEGSYRIWAQTVGENDTASTPSVSVVVLVSEKVIVGAASPDQSLSYVAAANAWLQTWPSWARLAAVGLIVLLVLLLTLWLFVAVLRGIYQTIRRFRVMVAPKKQECIVRQAAPKMIHLLSGLRKTIDAHKRMYGEAMDRPTAIQELDDLEKLVNDELGEMKADLREKG